MVVKVDVSVNHLVGLGESYRFVTADARCLENREEIFHPRIVIRIPRLDIEGVMLYCLASWKYA